MFYIITKIHKKKRGKTGEGRREKSSYVSHLTSYTLLLLLGFLSALGGQVLAQQKPVREPAVAGGFYPADESTLRNQIESFFSKVPKQDLTDRPIALVSPHAGYQYSGLVAAYGYNTIKGKNYTRVIILAPSHYGGFKGVSILNVTHYRTPLGLVEVDKGVCDKLLKETSLFGTYPEADKHEHSLETQLPFLQMVLRDFKLVPLLIGYLSGEDIQKVAECVKPLITEDTLLIASSDFTLIVPCFLILKRYSQ